MPRVVRIGMALVVAFCSAVVATGARANDRPFQVARTAVWEDDSNDWSFESWAQRLGSVRALSVEPEYTFQAGTSVQVELTRFLDRRDDETGHEAEVEFKQLFNDIARDGWGCGVSMAFSAERSRESRRTTPSVGLKVPVSIALGDEGGLLHLNVGITGARGERRRWSGAAGIERELLERTLFFAEAARDHGVTFMQVGARHWLRRDKLAIDFGLQRQRADRSRGAGFILGLGWYGL